MEKCKLLEAMPKDNRTATSRYLIRIGSAIKDVVRELGEAFIGQCITAGTAPGPVSGALLLSEDPRCADICAHNLSCLDP